MIGKVRKRRRWWIKRRRRRRMKKRASKGTFRVGGVSTLFHPCRFTLPFQGLRRPPSRSFCFGALWFSIRNTQQMLLLLLCLFLPAPKAKKRAFNEKRKFLSLSLILSLFTQVANQIFNERINKNGVVVISIRNAHTPGVSPSFFFGEKQLTCQNPAQWIADLFSLSCIQEVLPSVVCCRDRYLVDSRDRVRPQVNHLLFFHSTPFSLPT